MLQPLCLLLEATEDTYWIIVALSRWVLSERWRRTLLQSAFPPSPHRCPRVGYVKLSCATAWLSRSCRPHNSMIVYDYSCCDAAVKQAIFQEFSNWIVLHQRISLKDLQPKIRSSENTAEASFILAVDELKVRDNLGTPVFYSKTGLTFPETLRANFIKNHAPPLFWTSPLKIHSFVNGCADASHEKKTIKSKAKSNFWSVRVPTRVCWSVTAWRVQMNGQYKTIRLSIIFIIHQ